MFLAPKATFFCGSPSERTTCAGVIPGLISTPLEEDAGPAAGVVDAFERETRDTGSLAVVLAGRGASATGARRAERPAHCVTGARVRGMIRRCLLRSTSSA